MIKNKDYIYKNITNNKNLDLLFTNDNYYNSIKNNSIKNNLDISLNTITNLINKSILYNESIICIVPNEKKKNVRNFLKI